MCIRDSYTIAASNAGPDPATGAVVADTPPFALIAATWTCSCLLYTSDAADEGSSVDLGGRRIIKKKKEKR